SAFSVPTTTKSPRPILSNHKNVLFNRTNILRNSITKNKAKIVHHIYTLESIQKGVSPNKRSRNVPPPVAVTKPTTTAPNQSKLLAEAMRIPDTAKAKVPRNSIISTKVIDFQKAINTFIIFIFKNKY